MRGRTPGLFLAVVAVASAALAAPPPGHPTPGQAGALLGLPEPKPAAELPHEGIVLQAIDSNQFTYIEVQEGETSRWIAAPRVTIPAGTTIRFDDGRLMTNFYSRKLKRTFETLMFVGTVVQIPAGR